MDGPTLKERVLARATALRKQRYPNMGEALDQPLSLHSAWDSGFVLAALLDELTEWEQASEELLKEFVAKAP